MQEAAIRWLDLNLNVKVPTEVAIRALSERCPSTRRLVSRKCDVGSFERTQRCYHHRSTIMKPEGFGSYVVCRVFAAL
jgi:hypothetical protein